MEKAFNWLSHPARAPKPPKRSGFIRGMHLPAKNMEGIKTIPGIWNAVHCLFKIVEVQPGDGPDDRIPCANRPV